MKHLIVILLTVLLTGCSSLDVNLFGTHNKVIVNKTIVIYKSHDVHAEMIGASLSDLAKGNKQEGGSLQVDPNAAVNAAIGLPSLPSLPKAKKEDEE